MGPQTDAVVGLKRVQALSFSRDDQISLALLNPQASNRLGGTYLWSLFLPTQILSAVELSYWSGERPRLLTSESNELVVSPTAYGAALPQFGLPRCFFN